MILTSIVACMLGGMVVIMISAPRYQGSARVIVDYIQPDRTTGARVAPKMLEAYLASQLQLIRDHQVVVPALDAMGWLDSPEVQAAYYARPPGDQRDLASWLGAQVSAASSARMVEDSNMMEIVYVGATPEVAEAVVDALRASYIQSDVTAKRVAAGGAADALAARIEVAKGSLAELYAMKHELADATGLTMNASGRDEEAAKLQDLLEREGTPVLMERTRPASSELALRTLDAELATAARELGPNNPRLIEMRQRRIALQAQVETERSRANSAIGAAAGVEQAMAAMIEQQKAKVLAVREPTLRLRLLQDEINRQAKLVNTMTEQLIQMREVNAAVTSRITPVGPAKADREPVFPNKLLILGGSAGLGLLLGSLLALFVELLDRRIRATRDLEAATGAPTLAALPDFDRQPRAGRRKRAWSAPSGAVAPLPAE